LLENTLKRIMVTYPEFLYKYRPINTNTVRSIAMNEVYLSSPEQFNDPFDCKLPLQILDTDSDLEATFRTLKPNYPMIPDELFESLIKKDDTKKKARSALLRTFNEQRERLLKETAIYCLSEVRDDVLMFSHYADGHRGLCLQFKVVRNDFFTELHPVAYSDTFPSINFARDDPREFAKLLLCKSKRWSYEKEWRILKPVSRIGLYKFPSHILTGIIFGCRTIQDDIELIKSMTHSRIPILELFKARENIDELKLDIIPL
jgi:hypothetical protein